jgi:hypothetical protein
MTASRAMTVRGVRTIVARRRDGARRRRDRRDPVTTAGSPR